MACSYIALDTHCSSTDMAVVNVAGKLIQRQHCETTIPALLAAVASVKRPRWLTFEEGPLAGWLARNLRGAADELIVCDPRRNALVAKESDKDDPIDALKLAQLLRGGYLKPVHQASSLERALLKQHVALYHDRVRDRVRQGHEIVAQLRRHGVMTSIGGVAESWPQLCKKLPGSKVLRRDMELLLKMYQLYTEQEKEFRSALIRLARKEEPVRRFCEVPGFGWVRAVTFYVYIDTPERFASKSKLWRYCGIGLEKRGSGQGPLRTRLCRQGHRSLKGALMGAAQSVIGGDGPYAQQYQFWTATQGLPPHTARRNLARHLATTLWSLWKEGGRYDPARVCRRPIAEPG
jgi:transposase